MASPSSSSDESYVDNQEPEVNEIAMTNVELINHAFDVVQRAISGLQAYLYRNDQNRAGTLIVQDEYERLLVLQTSIRELKERMTREQ